MMRYTLFSVLFLSAAWLAVSARIAGQDADPFGAGAAQPAPGAAAPAPARATRKKTADGPEERDILVLDLRKSNPTTPHELMRAIRMMTDYGRVDEAKKYLQLLADAQPEDALLVELHQEFGSGPFIAWIHEPQFAPLGPIWGRKVLELASKATLDPQRMADRIAKLSDPAPGVRREAFVALHAAGASAVTPMLVVLRDAQRSNEHRYVTRALVAMGAPAIPPLIGALSGPDEALRAKVIGILAELESSEATPYLVRSAVDPHVPEPIREAARAFMQKVVGALPSRVQAEQYLFRRAQAHYAGKLYTDIDEHERRTEWVWDDSVGGPVPRKVTSSQAALAVTARLAAELYALDPTHVEYRRLYLHATLESAKANVGLDEPVATGAGSGLEAIEQLKPAELEDGLSSALQADRSVAAVALAELLGRLGDTSLLQSPDGTIRPLVRAARHPYRRLRMAAANAILTLDPQEPYPGSSYVAESLAFVFANVGTRRALVVHPRGEQLQTLVGLLGESGFDADSASTGKQVFQLAVSRSDYEFILLSDATDYPPISELVQSLRADSRTSHLPIGIMAREDHYERMQRLASRHAMTIVRPTPNELATVALMARELAELPGNLAVPRDVRLAHAQTALRHFGRLAAQPNVYRFYDLFRFQRELEVALFTPELSALTSQVLAHLGSPQSQRALLQFVHLEGASLEDRQAAFAAFSTAVDQRGILLTQDEIRLQYRRYNGSANAEESVQRLLGGVLDVIEAPSKQAQKSSPAQKPSTTASPDRAPPDRPKSE